MPRSVGSVHQWPANGACRSVTLGEPPVSLGHRGPWVDGHQAPTRRDAYAAHTSRPSRMSCTIPHRHLWSPERLSAAELHALLDSAAEVKRAKQRDPDWAPLRGRHIAVLAQHNDDATAGFERAVRELGGKATRLDARAWQSSAAARVSDAARMLGRLYEAIDCSDLPVPLLEQIDAHCGVPVFNGLARPDHPLSAVGALLTMREASGKPLERLHVQLGGDANSPRQRGSAALARLVGIDARPR